jgi:hypothetical protein
MNGATDTDGAAPASDAWMADSMRLTFFPPEPNVWPESMLEKLIGQTAEVTQTSKRGPVETRLEAGKFKGFQINAVAVPARLDIHIAVFATPEAPDAIVRPADDFMSVLVTIGENASAFAPFGRVGIGASLMRMCNNKTDVYKSINTRFPCLELDETSSDDFSLQMNRVLDDEEHGRINRIERWSYGLYERFDIPVMGGVLEFGRGGQRLEGVKMDLDFNTAPVPNKIFDEKAAASVVTRLSQAIFQKMKDE